MVICTPPPPLLFLVEHNVHHLYIDKMSANKHISQPGKSDVLAFLLKKKRAKQTISHKSYLSLYFVSALWCCKCCTVYCSRWSKTVYCNTLLNCVVVNMERHFSSSTLDQCPPISYKSSSCSSRCFSTESKLLLQNILCDQSAALKLCSYSLMIVVLLCKNTVILCWSLLAVFYSNLNHGEGNVTETVFKHDADI